MDAVGVGGVQSARLLVLLNDSRSERSHIELNFSFECVGGKHSTANTFLSFDPERSEIVVYKCKCGTGDLDRSKAPVRECENINSRLNRLIISRGGA